VCVCVCVCDAAKLGKDGKPETCRAITKIDYRTVRNRSAGVCVAFPRRFRVPLAILLPAFHFLEQRRTAVLVQSASRFI